MRKRADWCLLAGKSAKDMVDDDSWLNDKLSSVRALSLPNTSAPVYKTRVSAWSHKTNLRNDAVPWVSHTVFAESPLVVDFLNIYTSKLSTLVFYAFASQSQIDRDELSHSHCAK